MGKKGTVRYIIFKEGKTWYGVALEFNIVESGDDPKVVYLSLLEAIQGYVECAKKNATPLSILIQKTDPEYEAMWQKLNRKPEVSTYPIFNFGRQAVAA